MPTLSDLSPLESISLPGMGAVDCSGLILIVGPNSAGKSQLLRDIHQKVSGEPRKLVVASEIIIRKLPYEPLMAALTEAGFIYRFEDDGGTAHVRPMTTYVGTGQAASQTQINQLQNWHQNHNARNAAYQRRDEYLGFFGRFLITALFLDHRLTSMNRAGMIDFINSPPTHDLHTLYLNDAAREQLFSEIKSSFAKAVWPDISTGTGVSLRVSDQGDIPSHADRLSPTRMNGYRTIETEGDGLKSYVATCVSLLLGRRPVCLVDEPEMCLHPPQAYNLGRFIGEFGASREGATFVATHSSHILRGVIQTASKLQIIRLTRLGSQFRAHLVPQATLEQAMAKPTVRAESVLDGIFAQAVVVVEADTDRTVYQSVWEAVSAERRLDIHFATVGGTGGIADTCGLYRALRIPVAVVADLDVITDADRMRRVLTSLGSTETGELVLEAQRLVGLVRGLPPTISEAEVRSEITSAMPPDMAWSRDDDALLRGRLNSVARRIDRMRRLKTAASEPLPEAISAPLAALLARLNRQGLFVVPVGELEEWLAGRGIQASRQNKWAWANEAASLVRQVGRQPGDVWDFVSEISRYLDEKFEQLAVS